MKSGLKLTISSAFSIEELENALARYKSKVVLMNPTFIQNNLKAFNYLKTQYDRTKWVAIQYSHFDKLTLSQFDTLISVYDTAETVAGLINRLAEDDEQKYSNASQEILSEREKDVLKLLASGISNKMIADKLNISVNTVITHRKNISQKTGIKSISGLTIYAVVQKLFSIDDFRE